MMLKIQPIFEARPHPAGLPEGTEAIVLSSRIRLARNLAGFRFPQWASKSHRLEILARVESAVSHLPKLAAGLFLPIEQLEEIERQVLVERHLISKELSEAGSGAAVAVTLDQSTSIMINEEDHLRLQMLHRGFNFELLWSQIDALDSALEDRLDFAYHPELGYLTSCPSNTGTGLRASVMLHLPGLVIASEMEKVIRAVGQLGLAVRGWLGEGSDASGSVFQISNQQTLGESEATIMQKLSAVLKTIVEHEENARLRLLEKDGAALFDRIGRAFGILRQARLLTSSEAMNHLSLLRLACDMGFLPASVRGSLDRLFIESQPAHVQVLAHETLTSRRRDLQRATLIREQIARLSEPHFDNPEHRE